MNNENGYFVDEQNSSTSVKVLDPDKGNNNLKQQKPNLGIKTSLYKAFMKNPKDTMHYLYLAFLNKRYHSFSDGITGFYYLASDLQNTLVYGMTRSGKGQMIVNTSIELNSRAEKKMNMMVTDPKGELASGMYETLRKRNFDVYVLNLLDPMQSMAYNPLQTIIEDTRMGDIGKSVDEAVELGSYIYHASPDDKNKFFYDSAANLFVACLYAVLGIAHGDYYYRQHPELSFEGKEDKDAYMKVTIPNLMSMVPDLQGKQVSDLDGNDTTRLDIFFDHVSDMITSLRNTRENKISQGTELDDVEEDQLDILNQSRNYYSQFKTAGAETGGNILSQFMEGLSIYQSKNVKMLTSRNSMNFNELGFDRLLTIHFDRGLAMQKCVVQIVAPGQDEDGNIVPSNKIIEEDHAKLSPVGILLLPIEKSIPYDKFFINIRLVHERLRKNVNTFDWTLACTKHYWEVDETKKAAENDETAPLVSDLQIVDNPYYNEKNDEPKQIVVNKYQKGQYKQVLRTIKMKTVFEPQREQFSSNVIGINRLNNLYEEQNTLGSLHEDGKEFLYKENPTIVFLVTPPDRTDMNQLATFVINQVSNTLSGMALRKSKTRKLQRPLSFIFDEIGNIPPINKLDTKVSIALSQKEQFCLILQSKEQLTSLYKQEPANIILQNCGVKYFIMSDSKNTVGDFVEDFGKRTISTQSRNGNPTKGDSVTFNEGKMAQDVLPSDTLRNLKIGEVAITQKTSRITNLGKRQESRPIFDEGSWILPYTWWFLKDAFNGEINLDDIDMLVPHKYLQLENNRLPYEDVYKYLESLKINDKTVINEEMNLIDENKDKNKYLLDNVDDYNKITDAVNDCLDLFDLLKKNNGKDMSEDDVNNKNKYLDGLKSIGIEIDDYDKVDKNDPLKYLIQINEIAKSRSGEINGKVVKQLNTLTGKILNGADNQLDKMKEVNILDNIDSLLSNTSEQLAKFEKAFQNWLGQDDPSEKEEAAVISYKILLQAIRSSNGYQDPENGSITEYIDLNEINDIVNNWLISLNVLLEDEDDESIDSNGEATRSYKFNPNFLRELSNNNPNLIFKLLEENGIELHDNKLLANDFAEIVQVIMRYLSDMVDSLEESDDAAPLLGTSGDKNYIGLIIFAILTSTVISRSYLTQNGTIDAEVSDTTYITCAFYLLGLYLQTMIEYPEIFNNSKQINTDLTDGFKLLFDSLKASSKVFEQGFDIE